ncbi:hypothetical protein [Methylobacterium sp. WL69]|uniref:hypothetical protein n=1 Tax=Methylobacterium sp. WL69 TaxID=2603893 RepID=UPI001FED2B51|nr:hypothetical protein [Methylobacterium sp. WL69]
MFRPLRVRTPLPPRVQAAGTGNVVVPGIGGVEAAERPVHRDGDLRMEGAVAVARRVEVEARIAGAVVEGRARRDFGGGQDLPPLRRGEVREPGLQQHLGPDGNDRREVGRSHRRQAVGEIVGVGGLVLGVVAEAVGRAGGDAGRDAHAAGLRHRRAQIGEGLVEQRLVIARRRLRQGNAALIQQIEVGEVGIVVENLHEVPGREDAAADGVERIVHAEHDAAGAVFRAAHHLLLPAFRKHHRQGQGAAPSAGRVTARKRDAVLAGKNVGGQIVLRHAEVVDRGKVDVPAGSREVRTGVLAGAARAGAVRLLRDIVAIVRVQDTVRGERESGRERRAERVGGGAGAGPGPAGGEALSDQQAMLTAGVRTQRVDRTEQLIPARHFREGRAGEFLVADREGLEQAGAQSSFGIGGRVRRAADGIAHRLIAPLLRGIVLNLKRRLEVHVERRASRRRAGQSIQVGEQIRAPFHDGLLGVAFTDAERRDHQGGDRNRGRRSTDPSNAFQIRERRHVCFICRHRPATSVNIDDRRHRRDG